MTDSKQAKGDRLERAVSAIEQIILRDSPGYSQDRFRFTSKHTVITEGVRHEIDLYVEIDHGKGYDTVFVFECKNWVDVVNKNEVIIFAEKIKATKAHRGFLVARSFSKYAVAQAALEPRIFLLHADELPADQTPVPFHFHWVNIQLLELNPSSRSPVAPPGTPMSLSLDPTKVQLSKQGKPVALHDYLMAWGYEVAQKETDKLATYQMAQGKYDYASQDTRTFQADEVKLNGYDISSMTLNLRYQVQVYRPPIVSHVQVTGRGRVVETEPVRLFKRDLSAVFVAMDGEGFKAMRVEAREPLLAPSQKPTVPPKDRESQNP